MTWDEVLAYCLAKPGAWQDEPWDGDVVAKVGQRIFAFLGSGTSTGIGLKCGPSRDVADEWLHRHPEDATAMAYIGRFGWNTLRFAGEIPDDEVTEAIDTSYDAIVAKLPKRDRPQAWRVLRIDRGSLAAVSAWRAGPFHPLAGPFTTSRAA